MALESVTNVNDLVKANPTSSGKRHQGDDHIRNIKRALLAMLNGVPGSATALPTASTIATGDITPVADTNSFLSLAGEAATTDILDRIIHTNLYNGGLVLIKSSTNSYNITLNHGVGSGDELIHQDAHDIILTDTDQYVLYYVDKTNSKNYEIFRSPNLLLPLEVSEESSSPAAPATAKGSLYAYDSGKTITESGTGTTSMGLIDDQGFLLRLTQDAAILTDAAHDMSAYATPEVPGTLFMTPTAERIITLPTTLVPKGWAVRIHNLASDGSHLTINASGGTEIGTVLGTQSEAFYALQNTPTTNAHWGTGKRAESEALSDAAKTLVAGDAKVLTMTPSVTRIVTLPTTNVPLGYRVTIWNLASDQLITINSSDTTAKMSFQNGFVTLMAKQATPTGVAHWKIVESIGGAKPHFAANRSSNQAIGSTSHTKIQCDTEEADNNANYDSSGNYRFTPTVPGVYDLQIAVMVTSVGSGSVFVHFYKNGASVKNMSVPSVGSNSGGFTFLLKDSANGSTDYYEAFIDSTTDNAYTVFAETSFHGIWLFED